MSDGADALAIEVSRQPFTKDRPLRPIGTAKTHLYEFVGIQEPIEFEDDRGRDAIAAELEGGIEALAQAAEVRALCARERFMHAR